MSDINVGVISVNKEDVLSVFPKKTAKYIKTYRSLLSYLAKIKDVDGFLQAEKNFLENILIEEMTTIEAFDYLIKLTGSFEIPEFSKKFIKQISINIPSETIDILKEASFLFSTENNSDDDNIIDIILKKTKYDLENSKKNTLIAYKAVKEIITDRQKEGSENLFKK